MFIDKDKMTLDTDPGFLNKNPKYLGSDPVYRDLLSLDISSDILDQFCNSMVTHSFKKM